MAIIPKPQFPNVPKLPGVPQILRSPNFPAAPSPVLGAALALGRLWQALFSQPQWAIYKTQEPPKKIIIDGVETEEVQTTAERTPVVLPDSFLEFGYRSESSVSDYPVQRGGFMSYDKVANPFECFVRMSKGGSQQAQKAFLDSIDAIIDTLDLYDILTRDHVYVGVNVLRFEVSRRGPKGAYFLTEVDLYFREIRQVVATYTSTSILTDDAQNSSAVPVQNTGSVAAQPTTLTPEAAGIAGSGP